MKLTPEQTATLVGLVAQKSGSARVTITGRSMRPLLRAGMIVDVESFARAPRVGDIAVFRTATGLTAHRVVEQSVAFGDDRDALLTAGDAFPQNLEVVDREHIVGRVAAVWSKAGPEARRVDGLVYHLVGVALARTRRPRSLLLKVRETLAIVFANPKLAAPPRAFAALVRATAHFESDRYAAGLAALFEIPRPESIAMMKRHHASGLVFRWCEDAIAHGVDVPEDFMETLRRLRWTTALQAGRVLRCVADVRDHLDAAGIPYIVLKGGARLASGAPDADLQYSGDVDVIVPGERIDEALATLRAAGYRDHFPERRRQRYRSLHHRSPLRSPHVDVPVEVHVSLTPKNWVTQPLRYEDLAKRSMLVRGPVGSVRVLDRIASAVHLAYHGRDFRTWRDNVLLSRMLRDFDASERDEFDSYIRSERRESIRIRSVVSSADAISNRPDSETQRVRRYLVWAKCSEDLPRRIARNAVLEVVLGGYLPSEVRYSYDPSVLAMLRGWGRSALLLPAVMRYLASMKEGRA